MPLLPRTVRLAGWGLTPLGKHGRAPVTLVQAALGDALSARRGVRGT